MSARQSNGLRVLVALLGTRRSSGTGSRFRMRHVDVGRRARPASTPATVPVDATIRLVMVVTGRRRRADSSSSSGGGQSARRPARQRSSSGQRLRERLDPHGLRRRIGRPTAPTASPDAAAARHPTAPTMSPRRAAAEHAALRSALEHLLRHAGSCRALHPGRDGQVRQRTRRAFTARTPAIAPGATSAAASPTRSLGAVQTSARPSRTGASATRTRRRTRRPPGSSARPTPNARTASVCIKQTCEFGAMLNLCGLQSQDPFDCTPPARSARISR